MTLCCTAGATDARFKSFDSAQPVFRERKYVFSHNSLKKHGFWDWVGAGWKPGHRYAYCKANIPWKESYILFYVLYSERTKGCGESGLGKLFIRKNSGNEMELTIFAHTRKCAPTSTPVIAAMGRFSSK